MNTMIVNKILFFVLLLSYSFQTQGYGYGYNLCYLVSTIKYDGVNKICRYECEDGTRTVRKVYDCEETIVK